MSLPSRLLGANPSIQVSTLLSGSLSTPSAKQAFIPTAFQSIATLNGDGSSFEYTFTSIPSTFQHLQIRCFMNANNTSAAINLRLNGDTGSNYTRQRLISPRTTPTAVVGTTLSQMPMLGNAGLPTVSLTYGVSIIDILDYANTNKYKVVRYLSGQDSNTSGGVDIGSGLWTSTSAITSITIKTNDSGQPLNTASHIALYGIKGA